MPPLHQSPFPDGQLAALWACVTEQLRQAPNLQAVREWQLWDGSSEATSPVPFSELPALRLTPQNGQFRWADEQRFEGPLTCRIEIAVEGSRAVDLFNFWEQVGRALSRYATSVHDPNGGYFGNWLIGLGCYQVTMTGPALEPQLTAEAQAIAGVGTIVFSFNVDA